MSDLRPEPVDVPADAPVQDRGSDWVVLMWIAGFLATLVLFTAYCWWKAHTGAA